MAIEDALIYTIPQEFISKMGSLMTILQALGGMIILYIIFNIINMIINRKKGKEIQIINQNLMDIKKILMSQNKRKK
jgi:hypothetical protein